MIERELCQRGVADAERRLQAWLDEVDDERLLVRLADEAPLHPLLWGYRLGVGLMSMLVALCLATLATPLFSTDLARALATIDGVTSIPTPLVLLFLGYSFGAAGVSARWFAVQRGARSPMLLEETRVHEALQADLRRAQTHLREFEARASGLSA